MKEKIVTIKSTEYSNIDELDEVGRKLIEKAREASKLAYAPYSGFKVGSAVLLENKEIVTGNNQENAASPSGLCAERTALFYASAKYPGIAIKCIAISALKEDIITEDTIKPCGSCLQVIAEYEEINKYPIKILLDGNSKIDVIEGIDNLLPFRFRK